MRRVLAALVLAMTVAPALAQAPHVALTIDNDSVLGQDRHYTAGIQLAFAADNWLRIGPEPRMAIAFGQRVYGPDVKPAFVQPGDRPFAGWLYAMADVTLCNDAVVDHALASIGIVGPSARGREAQDAIHDLYGKPPVTGWRDQLRDEVAVLVGFERAWPSVAATRWHGNNLDLSLRSGVLAGNVLTAAHAGVVLRYGPALPRELPVPFISPAPPRAGASRGWHVWAGADAHTVARNIFLDGNTRKESLRVDRKPLGLDLHVGAEWAWESLRIGVSLVRRSPEFRGQLGADRFARLTLSIN